MKIFLCILFLLNAGISIATMEQQTADCFTYGAKYMGVSLNDPAPDQTDNAEDCQSFCQTVPGCGSFSWVDGNHDTEELRLLCTLWFEYDYIMVDKHYVSGPREC